MFWCLIHKSYSIQGFKLYAKVLVTHGSECILGGLSSQEIETHWGGEVLLSRDIDFVEKDMFLSFVYNC